MRSIAPDRTKVSVISQRLLARVGLGDVQAVQIDAESAGIDWSRACSASMNAAIPPCFCTLAIACSATSSLVRRSPRWPRGRPPIPAPAVQRDRTGRDDLDGRPALFPELHDGATAETVVRSVPTHCRGPSRWTGPSAALCRRPCQPFCHWMRPMCSLRSGVYGVSGFSGFRVFGFPGSAVSVTDAGHCRSGSDSLWPTRDLWITHDQQPGPVGSSRVQSGVRRVRTLRQ